MNPDEIITFLTIVQSQSISRAAQALYLSQSTVSQRLKNLEVALGVQLIDRHKGYKNTQLTPAGIAFVDLAKEFIALYSKTEELKKDGLPSRLSVGCSDSLTTYLFNPFFEQFLLRHPDIELSVLIHDSEESYRLVETRELDIALTAFSMNNRQVDTRIIHQDRQLVVTARPLEDGVRPASQEDALQTAQRLDGMVSPNSLSSKQEIYLDWGIPAQNWHYYWFGTATPKYHVNTLSLLRCFLHSGNGWAIVPASTATAFQKGERYYLYGLDCEIPNRLVHLVKPRIMLPYQVDAVRLFEQEILAYLFSSLLASPLPRDFGNRETNIVE